MPRLVRSGPGRLAGDRRIALASVIAVDIWHWTPFVFLLMLAGLESLDEEVFRPPASTW